MNRTTSSRHHDRWCNEDAAAELARPLTTRIERLIREGRIDDAILLTGKMKESRILFHDFLADSCTVLWSWVGNNLGEASIEDMFRTIFLHSAKRQFYDAAMAMAPPHLTVYLLAKAWRAHSCFGAGEYPGGFRIEEDDEKFTFHLTPCGSGLRLWAKGWYTPGREGKTSESPHRWTYGRAGFPYYCIHCPFMNEILPYESPYGSLMWPVDPPSGPEDSCAWHIYKDLDRIPERYYTRLELRRRNVPRNRYVKGARNYFTEKERAEMSLPMTERIVSHLKNGDTAGAISLCRETNDEFIVLHDLYINMVVATLTFIAGRAGEEALGNALETQFNACVKNQMVQSMCGMPAKEKIEFLAMKIFGIDNCNGSGYYPGKFTIIETDREITFTLDPCGSGGRLIRAGSYEPMGPGTRMREALENAFIRSSRFVVLPEAVLKASFPLIVNHFTQRKPFGQGATEKPHSWSFSKSGVPYFCCQCGMLQEKSGVPGLTIIPPHRKDAPCIWKFEKKCLDN